MKEIAEMNRDVAEFMGGKANGQYSAFMFNDPPTSSACRFYHWSEIKYHSD